MSVVGNGPASSVAEAGIAVGREAARLGITTLCDMAAGGMAGAEELALAKDSFLNSFVFNVDTRGKVISRMMTYEFWWLPRGEDSSRPLVSDTFNLEAGMSVRYANVLGEVFGGLRGSLEGALLGPGTLAERIEQADAILFVVDGQQGRLPDDEALARQLHGFLAPEASSGTGYDGYFTAQVSHK